MPHHQPLGVMAIAPARSGEPQPLGALGMNQAMKIWWNTMTRQDIEESCTSTSISQRTWWTAPVTGGSVTTPVHSDFEDLRQASPQEEMSHIKRLVPANQM